MPRACRTIYSFYSFYSLPSHHCHRIIAADPFDSPMATNLEYTVQEVSTLLKAPNPPKLIDVRQPAEWDIVHLEGAQLLDQELVDEMVGGWDRTLAIVCYCHHGMRSLSATAFLAQQGFTNVKSMRGGIDAWAVEIDPKLNRY
jgi:rhodanese-related sulfurtransferase